MFIPHLDDDIFRGNDRSSATLGPLVAVPVGPFTFEIHQVEAAPSYLQDSLTLPRLPEYRTYKNNYGCRQDYNQCYVLNMVSGDHC